MPFMLRAFYFSGFLGRKLSSCSSKTGNDLIPPVVMKYLNVAEKNDAAKNIAGLLSRGSANRREGLSPYNKIYEFQYNIRGQQIQMVMTSVSGHLLNHEFLPSFRGWHSCSPEQLFDAPVRKSCTENGEKIKKTLEREVRGCHALVIWTDCDREGENIGFEIMEVCRAIKPQIRVLRAKFSEITGPSVKRAVENLTDPDERQNDAVNVRSELDLRIGAAFTRFQTLRLQNVFPEKIVNNLVSYGSCQIPTLGFVAQRYKEIERFIPQNFWKIKLTHTIDELTVEFHWARNRLFDKQCCEAYLMMCQADPTVKIVNVTNKPKNKWRPTPMDTIELEKLGSRKLKISAKQTMTIAEKLYTQGIISYPRTETNMFTQDMKLGPLVEMQANHPDWGSFAQKVLEWGPNPRNGKKSDQAHPPIHPTKFVNNLNGDERKVYELIVRHFLACVSRDAVGAETIVNAILAEEEFTASGLCVLEKNYLEVYPYERWNSKEIHRYQIGNTFEPTELDLHEGSTTAPNMLTEADLIALMEKHGIGTDATHAEHINTIKERGYIGEVDRGFLVPGTLGMGLVEGYESMDLPLAQPELRAGLEADLKLICEGQKDPKIVLAEQIQKYKEAYRIITAKARALDQAMGQRLNEAPRDAPVNQPVAGTTTVHLICKCPKCSQMMTLKTKKDGTSFYLGCLGFPDCKNCVWFDENIKEATGTDEICTRCGGANKKIEVKFKQSRFYGMLNHTNNNSYRTCIVCDDQFRDLLGIDASLVKQFRNNGIRADVSIPQRGTVPRSTNLPSASVHLPSQNPSNGSSGRGTGHTNTTRWNSNEDDDDDRRGGGGGGVVSSGRTNSTTSSGWGTTSWNSSSNSTQNRSVPPTRPTNFSAVNTGSTSWNQNSRPPQQPRSRTSFGVDDADVVMCRCNQPAKELTVKKDGPNKGRQFFSCCKPQNEQCGFFQWADENTTPAAGSSTWGQSRPPMNSNESASGYNGGGGSFAGGNKKRTNTTTSDWGRSGARGNTDGGERQKATRKCGFCRQEGHTKAKCPQRQNMDF
ncbi:DNA topoisomerase 3-alpha [Uranotaenia lowii]|uniref:DNA topoisomerase 3-alpha n=1 Tax=Uranotaenia lowii TaxID=190385 RepID=UPI00247A4EC1|nr:DNA topoisomerase 3-alpha [Uranotaenia lowii]